LRAFIAHSAFFRAKDIKLMSMKSSRIAVALFGLLISTFWHNADAMACSCRPSPKEKIVASSDIVVVGRVLDVRVDGELRRARVEVEQTIKGTIPPRQILELVTQLDSAQCGYDFKVSDEAITIAADRQDAGELLVHNCKMYSLKTADRRMNAAKKALQAEPKVTSASCMAQNQTGTASCEAICPTGRTVVGCTHNAGKLISGDTCSALTQVFAGSTDENGQPDPQPHDRCSVSASCSDDRQTLSAQAWASCSRP
jgi:hypothetical protein